MSAAADADVARLLTAANDVALVAFTDKVLAVCFAPAMLTRRFTFQWADAMDLPLSEAGVTTGCAAVQQLARRLPGGTEALALKLLSRAPALLAAFAAPDVLLALLRAMMPPVAAAASPAAVLEATKATLNVLMQYPASRAAWRAGSVAAPAALLPYWAETAAGTASAAQYFGLRAVYLAVATAPPAEAAGLAAAGMPALAALLCRWAPALATESENGGEHAAAVAAGLQTLHVFLLRTRDAPSTDFYSTVAPALAGVLAAAAAAAAAGVMAAALEASLVAPDGSAAALLPKSTAAAHRVLTCVADHLNAALAEGDAAADVDDWMAQVVPPAVWLTRVCRADGAARRYLYAALLRDPPRNYALRPECDAADLIRTRLVAALAGNDAASPLNAVLGDLLFALCGDHPARLVFHTGYGHAAGFLALRGLGPDAGGGFASVDSEADDCAMPADVNPITGCHWTAAAGGMSDDEKERSAEELAGLIHRLNELGIIKCELPGLKGDN